MELQSNVYLRADEQMKLNPICLVLMDEHTAEGEVGLLIRLQLLVPKDRMTFYPIVVHIPIHFNPKNRSIKKEIHFIPEKTVPPIVAAAIIHFVSYNPEVLVAIEEKLHSLLKKHEINPVILEMFSSFKEKLAEENISLLTISTMSKGLYLVEQNGEIIHHVGPFVLTERGGYFEFTTSVATLYDKVAQTVEVKSKMHLFLEQEKLGYYFEFYLNQQNFLHRKIYESLSDMLMNHDSFLERTLSVLESCTYEQPSVVQLIEKFRESM